MGGFLGQGWWKGSGFFMAGSGEETKMSTSGPVNIALQYHLIDALETIRGAENVARQFPLIDARLPGRDAVNFGGLT